MSLTKKTDTQKVSGKEELLGVWYVTSQFPWLEVLWFKDREFQVTSHYGKLFVVKGDNKLIRSLSDIVPELLKQAKKKLAKCTRFVLGNTNSRGLRLRSKQKVQEYFFDNELSVIKKAIRAHPQLFKTFLDKKRPLVIVVGNQRFVVDDPASL